MAEDQEKKPKATLIKHHKPAADKGTPSKEGPSQEKKKVVVVKKKKKPTPKVVAKKDAAKEPKAESTADAPPESKKTPEATVKSEGSQPAAEVRGMEPRRGGSAGNLADRNRDRGDQRDRRPQTGSRPGEQRERRPSGDRGYSSERSSDGRAGNFRDKRPAGSSDGRAGNFRDKRPAGSSDGRAGNFRDRRPAGSSDGRAGNFRDKRPGGSSGGRPGATGGRAGNYNNRGPGNRPPSGGRPQGSGGGQRGGRPGSFNKPGFPPKPAEQDKKSASKKIFKTKKKQNYTKNKKETVKERDFQLKKKKPPKTNPVPKEIDIMEVITVSDLARKMNLKASEIIGKLMGMGMMATINQQIDAETAELLASEYNCKVKIVSLYDETIIESEDDKDEELKARPPIVTVMGHVDHGKTKLLDAIRQTKVVDGEFGGITQHIGAYKVDMEKGSLVFLDTPGHEAFTQMRMRGAQLTDIVVLVVAANDGVMPQTVEAVSHAKEAGVPIIVAVNKVDLPEANIDRVKQQLSEYDLLPEDWGGGTLFCEVSALKGTGVQELMESILLQSEMMELKANYNCRAEGKVVESRVDHGRGIVSTIVIQRGTLRIGDSFVAGVYPGKVRAMFDDHGRNITEAPPATPVEVLGFTGIPNAGAPFQVTENERTARQVGNKRQELEKQGEAQNVKKITLDNLYDSIQDGAVQELKVIIKGDVHGSVEALQSSLEKLSTSEIKLNAIQANAGAIVENDVNLASASNAIIIGFHVRPTAKAMELAEKEKVEIRKYNVIYDVVDDIKSAMEGMLSPELREEVVGRVEVREVFKVPKIGLIAGCYVTSGKVNRNSTVHLIRDGVEIYTGKISSLKRFKDDVKSVETGYECGLGIENYNDIKVGDEIEVIEIKEIARNL